MLVLLEESSEMQTAALLDDITSPITDFLIGVTLCQGSTCDGWVAIRFGSREQADSAPALFQQTRLSFRLCTVLDGTVSRRRHGGLTITGLREGRVH